MQKKQAFRWVQFWVPIEVAEKRRDSVVAVEAVELRGPANRADGEVLDLTETLLVATVLMFGVASVRNGVGDDLGPRWAVHGGRTIQSSVHRGGEMDVEGAAYDRKADTKEETVVAHTPEACAHSSHSCAEDTPYMAESACSEGLGYKNNPAAVWTEAWAAAHGTLRANGDSSRPKP